MLLVGRDPKSRGLSLSSCMQNVIKGPCQPQFLRAFGVILTSSATVSAMLVISDPVSPSAFKTTSICDPSHRDASMCECFDYLHFSGTQAHTAEEG